MTQPQPLAHHFATQIKIAVLQTHFLADLLIELKWQGLRPVQHYELLCKEFDMAGGQIGIDGSARSLAHSAFDLEDNSLRSRSASLKTPLCPDRTHLQQPLAVAKIDELHPAMIASPVYPAGDRDFLTDELVIDLSTVM